MKTITKYLHQPIAVACAVTVLLVVAKVFNFIDWSWMEVTVLIWAPMIIVGLAFVAYMMFFLVVGAFVFGLVLAVKLVGWLIGKTGEQEGSTP